MLILSLTCSYEGWNAPNKICSANESSLNAPTNSTISLIIIFGPPITLYFMGRSGNSLVSVTSTFTMSLSMANLCAIAAAEGQCGQVMGTKTWMRPGDLTSVRICLVLSERSVLPFETFMTASINVCSS